MDRLAYQRKADLLDKFTDLHVIREKGVILSAMRITEMETMLEDAQKRKACNPEQPLLIKANEGSGRKHSVEPVSLEDWRRAFDGKSSTREFMLAKKHDMLNGGSGLATNSLNPGDISRFPLSE